MRKTPQSLFQMLPVNLPMPLSLQEVLSFLQGLPPHIPETLQDRPTLPADSRPLYLKNSPTAVFQPQLSVLQAAIFKGVTIAPFPEVPCLLDCGSI